MPRVKYARRKTEYIQTTLTRLGGDLITCLCCGYTGKADLIKSTALGSGYLERCASCKSTNIAYKETVMPWITDEWKGCYPSSWKGMIVPRAMSHPAKFSSKLIRRIYEHMRAEKWVAEGDRVIDPFGGVGLGSLDAMRIGLDWLGMELEVKFVELGQHNIANWDSKYHNMPKWGHARLVQGDSRKLLHVLNSARAADSSPPYAEMDLLYKKNGIKTEGKDRYERPYMDGQDNENYGSADGQLGEMKGNGFDAAISSPPFVDSLDRGGVDAEARKPLAREKGISNAAHISPIDMEKIGERNQEYGSTPGQLGGMEAGDFMAAMISPPYESGVVGRGRDSSLEEERMKAKGYQAKGSAGRTNGVLMGEPYGNSDGQLGQESGDDFWQAARQIVEQVYLALAPGGHACWVVKDYVKSKERVPFSDQWRQLCEAVGFVTLHEHRALLVHAKSYMLDGGEKIHESKSFFRRLAEKKNSPRVDWETVWCMVKPGAA